MNEIDNFKGKNFYLSNFFKSVIPYEGKKYPTVEHAFQAAKTLRPVERQHIRGCNTPREAKSLGQHVSLRTGWERMKNDIMFHIVTVKFVLHPELRDNLLLTGDAILREGNYWHDNYWGDCWCPKCNQVDGENNLGRILMEVRNYLLEGV